MMTAEDYLKYYALDEDKSNSTQFEGEIRDTLWTNNVIKYMEGYAKMAIQVERQPHVEKIEAVLNKHSEMYSEIGYKVITETYFDIVAEAILNSFEKTEAGWQKIK